MQKPVKVTFNETDRAKIEAAADRLGLSLAAFLRMSALKAANK